jgi:hypothetical protein
MRLVACVAMLFAGVVGGCKKPLNPTDRLGVLTTRSLVPLAGHEGLLIQSVLLERPVGDAFLDRDLWASTIPAGEPETRALHAENGLRVGILSGNLPQRFQDMLDSETVSPQEQSFNTRKEAVIPTAGPVDPCQFSLLDDLAGKPKTVELKQARCGILVRPQAAGGGRVRVWCEPQMQHGERREWYRPTEDGTGFAKFEEIPLEKFAALAFEANLTRDDCLVIGWQADKSGTIGAAMFEVEAENRVRQRVLVIRARQTGRTAGDDLPVIAGPYRR